jgi:hypothetical protein
MSNVIWQKGTASALAPVSRLPPLMAHREHRHLSSGNVVHHGVREVLEVVAVRSVVVLGPVDRRFGKPSIASNTSMRNGIALPAFWIGPSE